ncbi:SIS domain-containing protein [Alphaproteobacteria bacterium]|nr:SIS domain-containing protein [Alphaproteobacteria bacterium]
MKQIFRELETLEASINEQCIREIIEIISLCSGRIICLGAGRMGYTVQSFAMRLSHLGFNSYMLGDTALPKIKKGDLTIINSSSGETQSILLFAKLAKKFGSRLICITSEQNSSIAKIADHVLNYKKIESEQMMKTVYEQFTFLLFDYIAEELRKERNISINFVENNHSILE